MRIGLICGDGLPVSGLLTTFRNVLYLGRELGVLDAGVTVPADLGFSWRADKSAYFPDGGKDLVIPEWMELTGCRTDDYIDRDRLASELTAIRQGIARFESLAGDERAHLRHRIASLASIYEQHFAAWLQINRPDWVIAINMTLSDAVPATLALHRAAAAHYSSRPGGLVFWDHDLYGSCSVRDPASGARMYPERPPPLAPVPAKQPHVRWAVVSSSLAEEASSYLTELVPLVVPNVLPAIPPGLDKRHLEFRRQERLDPARPILANPARVFHVKGVHVAVQALAALRDQARDRRLAIPYLLLFGSLLEDRDYARQVVDLVHRLGLDDDVRFLGGVPLTSYRDDTGLWHLDEVDVLRLAAASAGGVIFTPSVPDVETVGLGPGLAAAALLPCLITDYDAFYRVYGPGLTCTLAATAPAAMERAAAEFMTVLQLSRRKDPAMVTVLEDNQRLVAQVFPASAWIDLWHDLHRAVEPDTPPAPATVTPLKGGWPPAS